MTDEADAFFASLGERSNGRLPPAVRGTISFELLKPDGNSHWLVTLADGGARAVPERRDADCGVHISAMVFERLLAGRDHIVSMLFRDCISVEGDLALFLTFRRLLPERADSRGPVGAMDSRPPRLAAERFGTRR
nr:SCP2 sterol-binding domain-containing protein [Micromonospora sp. DSM 115978]